MRKATNTSKINAVPIGRKRRGVTVPRSGSAHHSVPARGTPSGSNGLFNKSSGGTSTTPGGNMLPIRRVYVSPKRKREDSETRHKRRLANGLGIANELRGSFDDLLDDDSRRRFRGALQAIVGRPPRSSVPLGGPLVVSGRGTSVPLAVVGEV